jgi:hypothetical protein
LRFPFVGSLRLDVVPLAQLGLGPFEPSDFGALGPGLGSDAVKLNLQVRVVF